MVTSALEDDARQGVLYVLHIGKGDVLTSLYIGKAQKA
jgi:hypothetical protein